MHRVRILLITDLSQLIRTFLAVVAYETALECIKVLSRSAAGTSYLSTPAGIQTLRQHAQHETGNSTPKARQHAVSALCNVLLLHPIAPVLCVREGLGDWALRELASDVSTGKDQMWSFLMARVIMVLTSRATYGFLERLVDDLNGLSIFKAVGLSMSAV